MNISPEQNIYIADRSVTFTDFIRDLLRNSSVAEKYIIAITDKEGMAEYAKAFTSSTVDPENNYEVYEQLGDAVGKKFLIKYFYERFPQLRCSEGVKVVARLNINYGAKQSFFEIAKNLGFWQFITATNEIRRSHMKSLCEDVFEAFLGVTEYLLDLKVMDGVGYPILSTLLKSIFDKIKISLAYENLYDCKTRLKEVFDMYTDRLGVLQYKEEKLDNNMVVSRVYRKTNNSLILIGEGSASIKADAQQKASENAIKFLESQGIRKYCPRFYKIINKEEPEKLTTDIVNKQFGGKEQVDLFGIDQINELRHLKHTVHIPHQYKTTLLAYYCHNRDIDGVKICLEHKANPNVRDSNGMKPLDLLFTGQIREDKVRQIMKLLLAHGDDRKIAKSVYDEYYTKYNLGYFKKEKLDVV